MKHLYFVRHGLSVLNIAGRYAGQIETPLAPEGEEQARLAGWRAKDLNIDIITASPLSRTHDTATIIAQEIDYEKEIILNNLLIERNLGILEDTPWSPNRNIEGIEGVETKEELLVRAREALEFLHSLNSGSVLVVSHSAFGRALRHVTNPHVPFESPSFPNAEIVKFI